MGHVLSDVVRSDLVRQSDGIAQLRSGMSCRTERWGQKCQRVGCLRPMRRASDGSLLTIPPAGHRESTWTDDLIVGHLIGCGSDTVAVAAEHVTSVPREAEAAERRYR